MPEWVPKTRLGQMVANGEITSLEEIYNKNLAILEPEIVDLLVPNLDHEILQKNSVQRITKNGRRISYRVVTAVGNRDGYVGVGIGKGLEMRSAIDKSIKDAKRNMIHIKRGCGSWECACGEEHSIPFKVSGGNSSVKVEIYPAPKGTGIVAGGTAKRILELAGIKDAWSKTFGQTTTRVNFALATLNALRQIRKIRKVDEE